MASTDWLYFQSSNDDAEEQQSIDKICGMYKCESENDNEDVKKQNFL